MIVVEGAHVVTVTGQEYPGGHVVIDADRLQTLFPRTLGQYLDPGPPEPEHRLAAIGFIRMAGTDRLLADEVERDPVDRHLDHHF